MEAKKTPETLLAAAVADDLGLERLGATLSERPLEACLTLILASAAIFYKAEKGQNEKCNDFWDALVYCSTCASVGYGDIFARTPVGKIVGSVLMTIGPALTNRALAGPAQAGPDAVQREILATMKEILAELKARK
jgi:hypothetical protein